MVHLVSFVQPNKPNKPNKRDRPDRRVTEALSVIHLLLNGMHQPMQPSPPSTKQQVTVSLPTPLIERLRNEASGQVCPDVPPQPGVQKFARPPPGIRRTDTIRSAPRSLATHRTESPPQYPWPSLFTNICHSCAYRMSWAWHILPDQGLTCCTWRENSCWCIQHSLIQSKNRTGQTGQSNQSTLLYRKHGSCYL